MIVFIEPIIEKRVDLGGVGDFRGHTRRMDRAFELAPLFG